VAITVAGKTNGRLSVRPFGNIKNALNEVHFDFDFLVFFFMALLMRLTLENNRALLMNAT
jgi:hypothetical protein